LHQFYQFFFLFPYYLFLRIVDIFQAVNSIRRLNNR
jgi:hypothetical protein